MEALNREEWRKSVPHLQIAEAEGPDFAEKEALGGVAWLPLRTEIAEMFTPANSTL